MPRRYRWQLRDALAAIILLILGILLIVGYVLWLMIGAVIWVSVMTGLNAEQREAIRDIISLPSTELSEEQLIGLSNVAVWNLKNSRHQIRFQYFRTARRTGISSGRIRLARALPMFF